jgi:hypothetical protein
MKHEWPAATNLVLPSQHDAVRAWHKTLWDLIVAVGFSPPLVPPLVSRGEDAK